MGIEIQCLPRSKSVQDAVLYPQQFDKKVYFVLHVFYTPILKKNQGVVFLFFVL